MNSGVCEVCGGPATVHYTELTAGDSARKDHHYCVEHCPGELKQKITNRMDHSALLKEKLANIDALPIDESEKQQLREEMARFLSQLQQP